MAYYYDKGQTESQYQFIVEETAEVSSLPTTSQEGDQSLALGNAYRMVNAGSRALCVEDSKTYILTTNDEWVAVDTGATVSGGGSASVDLSRYLKIDAMINIPAEGNPSVVFGSFADVYEKIQNGECPFVTGKYHNGMEDSTIRSSFYIFDCNIVMSHPNEIILYGGSFALLWTPQGVVLGVPESESEQVPVS